MSGDLEDRFNDHQYKSFSRSEKSIFQQFMFDRFKRICPAFAGDCQSPLEKRWFATFRTININDPESPSFMEMQVKKIHQFIVYWSKLKGRKASDDDILEAYDDVWFSLSPRHSSAVRNKEFPNLKIVSSTRTKHP